MQKKRCLVNIDFISWKPGQNSDQEMECRKTSVKLSKPECEAGKQAKKKKKIQIMNLNER